MKKYTSVAALALKLSWLPVLAVFAAVGAAQWLLVYRLAAPNSSLIQAGIAFETLIRDGAALPGYVGFAALEWVLLHGCCEHRRVHSGYTLRRLGISETRVSVVYGLVFAGWFVVYWLFQLGVLYGLFWVFAVPSDPGPNGLFLAAYRSEYFHQLLPLREWFGYVRNGVLCLSFGFGAAFGGHQRRHRRSAFLSWMVPVAALFLMAREPGQLAMDVTLVVVLLVMLTGYWFLVRGGDRSEETI